MSKEEVYDAEIGPLVAQIIAICKRAGIPFHAGFALDGDLACTTHTAPAKSEIPMADLPGYKHWRLAYDAAIPNSQKIMMMTTRDKKSGQTTVTAILP